MTLKILAAQNLAAFVKNQESLEKSVYGFQKIGEFAQRYIGYIQASDPLLSAMGDTPIMPETKTLDPKCIEMLEENYMAHIQQRYQFVIDYLNYLDFFKMGTNITRAINDGDNHRVYRTLFYTPDEFVLPYLKVRDPKGLNALQNAILKGDEELVENILRKLSESDIEEYLKPKESFRLAIQSGSLKLIKLVLSYMTKKDKLLQIAQELEIALKNKLSEDIILEILKEIEAFEIDEINSYFKLSTLYLALSYYSEVVVNKLLDICDDRQMIDFFIYQSDSKNALQIVLSKRDINETIIIRLLNRIETFPTSSKVLIIPNDILVLATKTNNIKIVKKFLKIIPDFMMIYQLQFRDALSVNALDQSLINNPFNPLITLQILQQIKLLKEEEIDRYLTDQSFLLVAKSRDTRVIKKFYEILTRSVKKEMILWLKRLLNEVLVNRPLQLEIIENILTALETLPRDDIELSTIKGVLYLAAKTSNLDIFRRIKNLLPFVKIEYLYNPNGIDNALHTAVREKNNSEMVKEILLSLSYERRVELITDKTRGNSTAIYLGIANLTYAHIDNITAILKTLSYRDRLLCLKEKNGKMGFTPLHILMKKYADPIHRALKVIISNLETIEDIQELLTIEDFFRKTPLDYSNEASRKIVNKQIAKKRLDEKEDLLSRPNKKSRYILPEDIFAFND